MLRSKVQNREINSENFLLRIVFNQLLFYPTPGIINYAYSFGSSAGIFFSLQILTGIFLSMHYVADAQYAFESIIYIMQAVKYGWVFRYAHMNGASFIFIFLFLHIGRGVYYQSFSNNRFFLWISGLLILILMMATAFIGYVLPWGQMSFWGATVITNLITVAGSVGEKIVDWIWGGFCVTTATLTRFYSLHFILPFVILAIICLHLAVLHSSGSSKQSQAVELTDWVKFFPYFFYKDLFVTNVNLAVFFYFIGYMPNKLGHPDNWMEANPLVTPAHIVPEWYFTPFYAVLRAFSSKILGVCGMGLAIAILMFLPIFNFFDEKSYNSAFISPVFKIVFWINTSSFLILTYLGGMPAIDPFIGMSLNFAIIYILTVSFLNMFRKLKIFWIK